MGRSLFSDSLLSFSLFSLLTFLFCRRLVSFLPRTTGIILPYVGIATRDCHYCNLLATVPPPRGISAWVCHFPLSLHFFPRVFFSPSLTSHDIRFRFCHFCLFYSSHHFLAGLDPRRIRFAVSTRPPAAPWIPTAKAEAMSTTRSRSKGMLSFCQDEQVWRYLLTHFQARMCPTSMTRSPTRRSGARS